MFKFQNVFNCILKSILFVSDLQTQCWCHYRGFPKSRLTSECFSIGLPFGGLSGLNIKHRNGETKRPLSVGWLFKMLLRLFVFQGARWAHISLLLLLHLINVSSPHRQNASRLKLTPKTSPHFHSSGFQNKRLIYKYVPVRCMVRWLVRSSNANLLPVPITQNEYEEKSNVNNFSKTGQVILYWQKFSRHHVIITFMSSSRSVRRLARTLLIPSGPDPVCWVLLGGLERVQLTGLIRGAERHIFKMLSQPLWMIKCGAAKTEDRS